MNRKSPRNKGSAALSGEQPRKPPREKATKLQTAPCGNCPFKVHGAIELREGRLESIARELLVDDWQNFNCHKRLLPRTDRTTCAGAMVFLHKAGRPNLPMRLANLAGELDFGELQKHAAAIVDPHELLGSWRPGTEHLSRARKAAAGTAMNVDDEAAQRARAVLEADIAKQTRRRMRMLRGTPRKEMPATPNERKPDNDPPDSCRHTACEAGGK